MSTSPSTANDKNVLSRPGPENPRSEARDRTSGWPRWVSADQPGLTTERHNPTPGGWIEAVRRAPPAFTRARTSRQRARETRVARTAGNPASPVTPQAAVPRANGERERRGTTCGRRLAVVSARNHERRAVACSEPGWMAIDAAWFCLDGAARVRSVLVAPGARPKRQTRRLRMSDSRHGTPIRRQRPDRRTGSA